MQSYGALPLGQLQAKRSINVVVATFVVAAAALLAISLVAVPTRTVLVQKANSDDLVSSMENMFSDDGQQLASDDMIDPDRDAYADGVTGARLDRMSATSLAEEEKAEEAKEERIPDPLDKAGIAVDHWPWDSAAPVIPGSKDAEGDSEEKASMVESLMGAFQDKAHKNPLLTKQQLANLKEQHRERIAQQQEQEERALEQKRKIALMKQQQEEKEAIKVKEMQEQHEAVLKHQHAQQEFRREQREQEREQREAAVAAAAAHQQLATAVPAQSPLERAARQGWPAAARQSATVPHRRNAETKGARLVRKQEEVAKMLAGDGSMLQQMAQQRRGGSADAEEDLAQGLQAASFKLQELATLQKLEVPKHAHQKPDLEGGKGLSAWNKENLLGKDFDLSLQLFPSWYWTEDSASKLEDGASAESPLDAAHAARMERKWERAVAQKLREDALDMSSLAASDAKMGYFRMQALDDEAEAGGEGEGEDAGNSTETADEEHCNQDTPGCNKLGKIGVPVDHWPWAEAKAKREWERRLAVQVRGETAAVQRVTQDERKMLRQRQQGVVASPSSRRPQQESAQ